MTILTPRQLHAATVTRLDTHPTLTVFDGEPGEGTNGPVPTAPDGTVNPYAIVWAPTGQAVHTRLAVGASARRSRLWVTVAGGDARTLAPVDTGNLRSSIGVTADTGWRGEVLTATVGPTAHYGRYVEEGTSRMGPQPYMMPAADRHEPLFVAAIQSLGGQVL